MATLAILYLVSGALLILLALPLLFEKVPPNAFYGFRVAKTLDYPQIWYAVNKYAARRLVAAGASLLFAALIFYFIPGITVDQYALACLGVFVLVFGAGLIQSVHYMQTISQKDS